MSEKFPTEALSKIAHWLEHEHFLAAKPLFESDGEKARAMGREVASAISAHAATEKERAEARVCIQIVRERVEGVLANWMRPPGGQQAGVPDKSISPQTCRDILRSLTPEQGSYTYEEWCKLTDRLRASESRASALAARVGELEAMLRAAGVLLRTHGHWRIADEIGTLLSRPAVGATTEHDGEEGNRG